MPPRLPFWSPKHHPALRQFALRQTRLRYMSQRPLDSSKSNRDREDSIDRARWRCICFAGIVSLMTFIADVHLTLTRVDYKASPDNDGSGISRQDLDRLDREHFL